MWFYPACKSILNIDKQTAQKITDYCIDSRKIQKGSLFFALAGNRCDGHQFLEQAASKGAVAAVVQKTARYSRPKGLQLIEVDNVIDTLQALAKSVVQFWKPVVIAITGSLGKTSTKDFIIAFLKQKFTVWGTPGNYNSQLSLPITILNAPTPSEFLVLEMGIDQPEEMDRLTEIAPPHLAILTMLAHVHIEQFENFEHLAREKGRIFAQQSTRWAFYNRDMENKAYALDYTHFEKIDYSLVNPQAHYFLALEKSSFSVYKDQKKFLSSKTPFFDEKSHYNLLAAIAVADFLKVSKDEILKVIPELKHAPNRLQTIAKKGITFICDAYNANLDSMENALKALSQRSGRKVAILSDMVEQGNYNYDNHLKLAQLANQYADVLIAVGTELYPMKIVWKKGKKRWAFFLTYSNMILFIAKFLKKGDVVLLKGSRKQALERVINDFTDY